MRHIGCTGRGRLAALLLTSVAFSVPFSGSVGAQARSQPAADLPQSGSRALVGTVVDVIGRPLGQVEVYIAGTTRATRTDPSGIWRIANPPAGPRVVVARQLGYAPYVREVLVGSGTNDTLYLLLQRLPQTLSAVQVTERTLMATSAATVIAERLSQMRVGSGRLFTREEILLARPYSVAELIFGIPGVMVRRGQGEIVATTTRAGVGVMTFEGQACLLQFYLDNTPIDNESVAALDPLTFRSVEVYPQTVQLTGLAMRPDRCGAVVINSIRR